MQVFPATWSRSNMRTPVTPSLCACGKAVVFASLVALVQVRLVSTVGSELLEPGALLISRFHRSPANRTALRRLIQLEMHTARLGQVSYCMKFVYLCLRCGYFPEGVTLKACP